MKLGYFFSSPHRHFVILIVNLLASSLVSSDEIVVQGVGASFPAEVYAQWINNYMPTRRVFTNLAIYYNVTGSSKGLKAIQQDEFVDFAGSETLLPANASSNLKMLPTMAGAISIAYNIPEVKSYGFPLNLSREQLVGIYNGTFTHWNDSTFLQTNPGVIMPDAEILVLARQSKSGTTNMFTTALSAFDANWKQQYGAFSAGTVDGGNTPVKWNPRAVNYYGKKNSGMAGIIASFEYSIGYVVVNEAKKFDLPLARIENSAGHFISPDDEASIQKALDTYFQSSMGRSFTETLVDIPAEGIYPILGFTYMVIRLKYTERCEIAKELLRFIQWFTTDDYARTICTRENMVPITNELKAKIKREILLHMQCNGVSLWDMVAEDKKRENYVEEKWKTPVAVLIPLFCLLLLALFGYIIYQKLKLRKMINNNEWNIAIENILFYFEDKGYTKKSKMTFFKSIRSFKSINDIPDGEMILSQILQWPGRWKGQQIGIRLLNVPDFAHIDQKTKRELIWMREHILHSNVLRFYGLTEIDYNDRFAVNEYCSKGVLTEILQDGKYNLTTDFKFSLSVDIVSGMSYLHAMGLIHGNLHSSCCLIDSRWTVKIADWEYCRLYSIMNPLKNPLSWKRQINGVPEDKDFIVSDFWVAPEILSSNFLKFPTTTSDVYSFAIILQEIFSRDEPYIELADTMSIDEIFNAIIFNNLRPQTNEDTPVQVRQIMEIAWSSMANSRPTFDQILKMLKHANPFRKSVLDSMMEAMEEYTEHLEMRIEERTNELNLAKERMEQQLSRYVPKFILPNLISDQPFLVNNHLDNCFLGVELHEFKQFLAKRQMDDVAAVLKRIHFLIEDKTSKTNVCQIASETCTWIYLTGMENESDKTTRVVTIAHLALDWLGIFQNSDPHLQDLKIRVAIHIGNLHIGVAESPKAVYVFGTGLLETKDLLNSSKPSKIRISKQVQDILATDKTFHIDEDVTSSNTCYWLISRTKSAEKTEEGNVSPVVTEDCKTPVKDTKENQVERKEEIPLKNSPLHKDSQLAIPLEHNSITAPSLQLNVPQIRKTSPLNKTSNKIFPLEQ
ncbi:guanylyl cyclase GC-E-like [Octopus vulgaris]|uniref:Guanylyl cyclase GC-E-like n=1 Tax=Octopus vulgaris TaxID=6645 RepID=A0AA36F2A5_OCTVU|nr:guanylyl cyclase GC-E-like [Octopus vulgaris]